MSETTPVLLIRNCPGSRGSAGSLPGSGGGISSVPARPVTSSSRWSAWIAASRPTAQPGEKTQCRQRGPHQRRIAASVRTMNPDSLPSLRG